MKISVKDLTRQERDQASVAGKIQGGGMITSPMIRPPGLVIWSAQDEG